jgi:hypothetical protein
MSGKGSGRRPKQVSTETFNANWDKIFTPRERDDANAEDEAFELVRKKMADAQTAAWMKDEYYDQEKDSDES